MTEPNSFVLDSYAVIGFLENEPFSGRIEDLLVKAQRGRLRLYLHAIQLGEVYYITLREGSLHLAELAYARINALPVKIIKHIDERLLKEACTFKANYPISYADSFAAALASLNNCPLLTGDPEFKAIEKDGLIQIQWLLD